MIHLTRRATLASALLPVAATAQEGWPNRDLRLIVPFPAGGTTDVVARLLAAEMGQRLGRPMI
eukprot:gene19219-23552_t